MFIECHQLTHHGYYEQIDGLAMGSSPAPYLANIWFSKYDPQIKGDAALYERYMDDVFTARLKDKIEEHLEKITSNIIDSLSILIDKKLDLFSSTVNNN